MLVPVRVLELPCESQVLRILTPGAKILINDPLSQKGTSLLKYDLSLRFAPSTGVWAHLRSTSRRDRSFVHNYSSCFNGVNQQAGTYLRKS